MDWYAVIGIILALLGLNALWNVPRQVRLHDRLVENRNENLRNWIADVNSDLRIELAGVTSEHLRAKEEWPIYLRIGQRQRAKNEVIKRLTDQTREAKQYRDQIELSEGFEHRLWRRTPWSRPLPELTALDEKADVIEKWREEVTEEEVEEAERYGKTIRKAAERLATPRPTPTGPFPHSRQG